MTATMEASKKESEAMDNHENDSNSNTTSEGTPVVENPRKTLKLKKMNNGQQEKRVYRIVLTGGKFCCT